ncbi:MAG: hypothetical protein BZY75_06400 [SAR202 cluster bacterium Io17-Chloro-G7]|nr:MAG: hypothetical protein BZY75_06400 [SAR202 cluster bacterium Io17-Chloro-G7]
MNTTSIVALDVDNIFIGYALQNFDAGGPFRDIKFAQSTDGGSTFTEDLVERMPNGSAGFSESLAVVDANNIYFSYLDARFGTGAGLRFARSAGGGAPPTPDSHWNGDVVGGKAADIVGPNDGYFVNGASSVSPGKIGNTALGFDGSNDHILVPYNSSQDLPGSFTIKAWVKTSKGIGQQTVISQYACGGAQCSGDALYQVEINDGKVQAVVRTDTGFNDFGVSSQFFYGTTNVADGQFHHIAFVRDVAGGKGLIYIDGVLESMTTRTIDFFRIPIVIDSSCPSDGCDLFKGSSGSMSLGAEPDPLIIGGFRSIGSGIVNLFQGVIDELELFQSALNDCDIKTNALVACDGSPDNPPTLELPADITGVEATGPDGATVNFTATATDDEDGTLTPSCSAASGDTFVLGTSQVDCSVTDSGNNTVEGSFNVTVVDSIAPEISVPDDFTVVATSLTGATVNYVAIASDAVGVLLFECFPLSGALFGIEDTLVTCNASDAASNPSEASFTITVELLNVGLEIQSGKLNLGKKGVLPVVIPGSAGLDVSDINVSSLDLNGAGAAHAGHIDDVDSDGFDDLVAHFPVPDLGFDSLPVDGNPVTLTLTGELNNGAPFEGTDSVTVKVPNENSNANSNPDSNNKGGKGKAK